jgi:hypothetical protein
MAECKKQVAPLARTVANTAVLDFKIDSALTRVDCHSWNPLHCTQAIADDLDLHIKAGVNDRRGLLRSVAIPVPEKQSPAWSGAL